MKKTLRYCCTPSLFLLFFLCSYTTILAQSEERIVHFDTLLQVQTDASIRVIETIQYDFGPNVRSGIDRDIPYTFTDTQGSRHRLSLSDILVTDEAGNSLPVEISHRSDSLYIQIGDPDVTVGGRHTYVLSYVAHNAVSFLPDRDELYWNVTGNEWDVPIEVVTSQVLLVSGDPLSQGFYQRDLHIACYRGTYRDTTQCDEINLIPSVTEENAVGTTSSALIEMIEFFSTGLTIYQGVTISVGFPKGVVSQSWGQSMKAFLWKHADFIDKTLAFLAFLFAGFFAWRAWYKSGHDPKGRNTIITEYAPPDDLSVLESAIILEGQLKKHYRIRSKTTMAAIMELAVKGALYIEEVEQPGVPFSSKKDYRITNTKQTDQLSELQKGLLFAIFFPERREVLISQIHVMLFATMLLKLENRAGELLVAKGYFTRNPFDVIGMWLVAGLGIMFAPIVVIALIQMGVSVEDAVLPYVGWLLLSVFTIGAMVMVFSRFMPQKTKKGALAKDVLMGLKKYISVAEKDRIEFHNAPAKTPELFEKLLPYAILLGVTTIWTKEFEGICTQSPSWYSYTDTDRGWNMADFSSHVDSFAEAFTSDSTPESSGGD